MARSAPLICGGCGATFVKPYRMSARRLAEETHFCSPDCKRDYSYRASVNGAESRFWRYVAKAGEDDCWLWMGQRDPNGYGRFTWRRGDTCLASRLSYRIEHGSLPEDLFVCHHCDNPPCVNPRHLFLGTHLDNMRDASRKGRTTSPDRRGEEVNSAKLTAEDVIAIRTANATALELSGRFGVTREQIRNIILRKQWRHVP